MRLLPSPTTIIYAGLGACVLAIAAAGFGGEIDRQTQRVDGSTVPQPRLRLEGQLELPNGWKLYQVEVPGFPLPYQCLVLETPQGGQIRCDTESQIRP